ncbi:hypothetical protein ACFL5O_01280 [Myxococcota bacterium]
MPFNRLARLQFSAGVPLPASTQWQLCEQTGRQLAPVYHELVLSAAQAELMHNDDALYEPKLYRVGVAFTLGGFGLLLIATWSFRRQRGAKRMSSLRSPSALPNGKTRS